MQKISGEFAARLDRLGPKETIRAVVLLRTAAAGKPPGRRQSPAERQAAVEAIRTSAQETLWQMDELLERFGGRRLAEQSGALGSVPVETTAAGIKALAASEWVKAVMEDQGIQPLF